MDTLYPTRLSNTQIRLLHILPSELPESLVSCKLQQYEIDNVPTYEALSYYWGDSTERHEIVCNGATHFVTASLRDALVRLRLTNEVRIVWADALCIAQSDEEEKSSQVRRMDSVFHRAKRVVVWLGYVEAEHSMNVKRLFESLRCFSGNPEDYGSHWRVEDTNSTFGDSIPWHSLRLFFANPWFRRMWCIQEIRLACDSVFYWGTEELSKYTAVRLAGWSMSDQQGGKRAPFTIGSSSAWRMNGPLTVDKCRLLQALSTYRHFQATDRRDKVYGILGLRELGEEKDIVPIDYTKSVREVYYDVATAIIRWTGDLAILAHVHHDVNYDGNPEYESWVPQWDRWWDVPPAKMKGGLSPTSCAYGTYRFDALHKLTAWPHGRKLLVSGLMYETVLCTSALIEDNIGALNYVKLDGGTQVVDYPIDIFLDYWRQKVSREAPLDGDASLAMKSMARTLTAGVVDKATDYHDASEENQVMYLRSFLDYINLLHVLSENVTTNGSIEYDFSRSGDGWELYASILSVWSYRRSLFRAKNGSFGLGPACIREGDVIVVLEGAYTPMALRQRGENYLLLGQVYMDEIMNGELIEEIEKRIREPQLFCLN